MRGLAWLVLARVSVVLRLQESSATVLGGFGIVQLRTVFFVLSGALCW